MIRGGCFFLRTLIAAVLLATGAAKALDLAGFTEVIDSYRVFPPALLWPVAVAMTVIELGLSVWLFSGRALRRAALAATALHLSFTAWIGLALFRGLVIPNCGCFGVFFPRPLGFSTLVEDGVMVAACGALVSLAALVERRSAHAAADAHGDDAEVALSSP